MVSGGNSSRLQEAMRDSEWYEREYNPRLAPELDVSRGWAARASALRARRPPIVDIQTGVHPRETLDLFRAEGSRGTLVFIHGGFWRVSSKNEMSWIAEGLLNDGYSVALLNYPLCPEVSLEALIESVRRSFATLLTKILNQTERAAIAVAGHSAGGYLAAALAATDWASYGLPLPPFHGVVGISGIFDLIPLIMTSHNRALQLDQESAARLSLTAAIPEVLVPMALVVGEEETTEFHRQSYALSQRWPRLCPKITVIPGANHYSIVEGLAQPGSALYEMLCLC